MKKSILEIYALSVCFATVVCFIIFFGIGIYDFVRIANPEFTMESYEYNRHQSNNVYWESHPARYSGDKEQPRLSEDELTRQRKESYQQALNAEKRAAFQSSTRSVIVIFVSAVFFLIHWRIAQRER